MRDGSMLLIAVGAAALVAGVRRLTDGPSPARGTSRVRAPRGTDETDLDVLFAVASDLETLGADPAGANDQARVYDFSIRWGTYLSGRLRRLEYRARAGALGSHETARYERLRQQLNELAPAAKRLGLAVPPTVEDGSGRTSSSGRARVQHPRT